MQPPDVVELIDVAGKYGDEFAVAANLTSKIACGVLS